MTNALAHNQQAATQDSTSTGMWIESAAEDASDRSEQWLLRLELICLPFTCIKQVRSGVLSAASKRSIHWRVRALSHCSLSRLLLCRLRRSM